MNWADEEEEEVEEVEEEEEEKDEEEKEDMQRQVRQRSHNQENGQKPHFWLFFANIMLIMRNSWPFLASRVLLLVIYCF